jgi:hypothetical protein
METGAVDPRLKSSERRTDKNIAGMGTTPDASYPNRFRGSEEAAWSW